MSGPFHPALNLNSQLFAVSLDGRHIYAAGIWDNSLKVINVSRSKTIASIIRHFDVITCVALDNCGSYIVTGSKDCTCIVWSLNNNSSSSAPSATASPGPGHGAGFSQTDTTNTLTPWPLNTLYGHENTVSCVAIFTELDIVVSGSIVSTTNIIDILNTYAEGYYFSFAWNRMAPSTCIQSKKDNSFAQSILSAALAAPLKSPTLHCPIRVIILNIQF